MYVDLGKSVHGEIFRTTYYSRETNLSCALENQIALGFVPIGTILNNISISLAISHALG